MSDEIGEVKIENALANYKTKQARRKRNSKAKGNRFESEVRDLLIAAYGEQFARTPGSGAFGTVMRLDETAAEVLSGDLMVGRFRFCVECKKGYDDIDRLFDLMSDGPGKQARCQINDWIEQAEREATKSGKEPLIVWSRTSRRPLCGLRSDEYAKISVYFSAKHAVFCYGGYCWVCLTEFLKVPKDLVFNQ